MKKALIHDWYYTRAGGEKVVHSITNIWNDFDHFALIDFLNEEDRNFILKGKKAKTTFIQNLPTVKNDHRKFLQLFPKAIKSIDLEGYDLVISSSSSIAKWVKTDKNQLHICYCHSPMRYAWDLQKQYIEALSSKNPLFKTYVKWVLKKMQKHDLESNKNVDFFVANSEYIADRIKRIYNRNSVVIYPPVEIEKFELHHQKQDYYLAASRLVSYKKIDVIVEAFNQMPEKKLLIIGKGPEGYKLQKMANNNIQFLGHVTDKELKNKMQNAKAFIFASEEDFGIITVEAQSCGTPVIAFNKGGSAEIVIDNQTGLFFEDQTPASIIKKVQQLEKMYFDSNLIRKNAERFSKARFEKELKQFVEEKIREFE